MTISKDALSEDELARYRAMYCGTCHVLGERFGEKGRIVLNHDMVFLALLLQSLYDPPEEAEHEHCMLSPIKKRAIVRSEVTEYAADMTIALVYHKCWDDWNDDRKVPARAYASLISEAYEEVSQRWPRQCTALEAGIKAIAREESSEHPSGDRVANHFGQLFAEMFAWREDQWSQALRRFGYELGRFIYFIDAAIDRERDIKKGSYNPFIGTDYDKNTMKELLSFYLARATAVFELLPLVNDLHIMRSVLYEGVWSRFNRAFEKHDKSAEDEICGNNANVTMAGAVHG